MVSRLMVFVPRVSTDHRNECQARSQGKKKVKTGSARGGARAPAREHSSKKKSNTPSKDQTIKDCCSGRGKYETSAKGLDEKSPGSSRGLSQKSGVCRINTGRGPCGREKRRGCAKNGHQKEAIQSKKIVPGHRRGKKPTRTPDNLTRKHRPGSVKKPEGVEPKPRRGG